MKETRENVVQSASACARTATFPRVRGVGANPSRLQTHHHKAHNASEHIHTTRPKRNPHPSSHPPSTCRIARSKSVGSSLPPPPPPPPAPPPINSPVASRETPLGFPSSRALGETKAVPCPIRPRCNTPPLVVLLLLLPTPRRLSAPVLPRKPELVLPAADAGRAPLVLVVVSLGVFGGGEPRRRPAVVEFRPDAGLVLGVVDERGGGGGGGHRRCFCYSWRHQTSTVDRARVIAVLARSRDAGGGMSSEQHTPRQSAGPYKKRTSKPSQPLLLGYTSSRRRRLQYIWRLWLLYTVVRQKGAPQKTTLEFEYQRIITPGITFVTTTLSAAVNEPPFAP